MSDRRSGQAASAATKLEAIGAKRAVKPEVVRAKSLLVKRSLRIHAIPLADDDGSRKYTFTIENLAKGIARANEALKSAAIELVFDPEHDWQPRNDTALNNLNNGGSNWWVKGNEAAARIPGKIVIFFRHGEGATPVGWGHAYPPDTGQTVPPSVDLLTEDVKYVALPNSRDWDTADNGNFIAHEVGHYLGLFHTHPGWGTSTIYSGSVDTAAKAEQAVIQYAAANGGTLEAFNGDGLSDTAPDCCRNLYDLRMLSHNSSGPASVTVSGTVAGKDYTFTLTPPRDNLMSYFFWGEPQKVTPAQAEVIHSTLKHDRRRILVEPPCNPDYHNVATSFQTCFDYWRHRGLHPHTLSFNQSGGQMLASGSFQVGSPMPVWTLMTSDEYQTRFDDYFAKGMRPTRVTVTATPSGPRFTAIWRKAEAAFAASHALTLSEFEEKWKDLREEGWLHTDMFIYQSGSSLLVAAIWVQKPWEDYASYYDMTADVYKQRFDDFWEKGLRVTTACVYRVGSEYRCSAIWERVPGRWGHWYDMTADQYQAKYDELAESGHRLHQIQAYADRFSAIWTG
jgi:hypothetical protein